jgi:DNA-binding response OmpR family regulator
MKVLLVEDDRLLAQEIARALRHENFAVDIAANTTRRFSILVSPRSPALPSCVRGEIKAAICRC